MNCLKICGSQWWLLSSLIPFYEPWTDQNLSWSSVNEPVWAHSHVQELSFSQFFTDIVCSLLVYIKGSGVWFSSYKWGPTRHLQERISHSPAFAFSPFSVLLFSHSLSSLYLSHLLFLPPSFLQLPTCSPPPPTAAAMVALQELQWISQLWTSVLFRAMNSRKGQSWRFGGEVLGG